MSEQLPVTQAVLNKARKDKFELVLTIPNVLKGINTKRIRESQYINLDSMQFAVYGVTIPSVEVTHVPLHYSGQNYNVTAFNRPEYPPTSVNFAVDNEFKNYWLIWKWLQLLNDPKDSTFGGPEIFKNVGGYPKLEPQTLYDYTTTIVLKAMDEYNNTKAEFEFTNCFATKLGNYTYSYRDPEEIDCTFEFVFNQLDVRLI